MKKILNFLVLPFLVILLTFIQVSAEEDILLELEVGEGDLLMYFVDGDNEYIPEPSAISFETSNTSFDPADVEGTFGVSSQKLRIDNATGGEVELSVSLDVSDFAEDAKWISGEKSFLAYSTNGSTGGLLVDPENVVLTDDGCGGVINDRTLARFTYLGLEDPGNVTSIDVLNTTGGSECRFDLTNLLLTQTIPPRTSAGSYSLGMVLTLVGGSWKEPDPTIPIACTGVLWDGVDWGGDIVSYKDGNILCLQVEGGTDGVMDDWINANLSATDIDTVYFLNGITYVGESVFNWANAFDKFIIGNDVIEIGEYAFDGFDVLNEVIFGNSITTIGASAFEYGTLETLVLPDSVTSIGSNAFARNDLTSVTLSNNLTNIPNNAFNTNKLTSVIIPSSVTTIGHGSFQKNKLTSITIPDNVVSIDVNTFWENELTSVTIGTGLTTISDSLFRQNKISSIIIPDNITSIGSSAFMSNELTSVTLGSGLTNIGINAFHTNQLADVTIPGTVTTIGSWAFMNNELTNITIPNSVTSIGDGALRDNQLTIITMQREDTVIGTSLLALSNNNFRTEYYKDQPDGGAGTYTGTQTGSDWTKQ
jgi:hypothetical protein